MVKNCSLTKSTFSKKGTSVISAQKFSLVFYSVGSNPNVFLTSVSLPTVIGIMRAGFLLEENLFWGKTIGHCFLKQ